MGFGPGVFHHSLLYPRINLCPWIKPKAQHMILGPCPYRRLYSKIYSIFNIILFELLVISVTSICKTYIFKFVLSLVILNFLDILNSGKKNVNYFFFNTSKIYILKVLKKIRGLSDLGLGQTLHNREWS